MNMKINDTGISFLRAYSNIIHYIWPLYVSDLYQTWFAVCVLTVVYPYLVFTTKQNNASRLTLMHLYDFTYSISNRCSFLFINIHRTSCWQVTAETERICVLWSKYDENTTETQLSVASCFKALFKAVFKSDMYCLHQLLMCNVSKKCKNVNI